MADQTPEQIEQSFADLDFTQGLRRRIVNGIADKAIADGDPEMLRTTIQALDGMDKQSLGKLKINEKTKENQTRADESEALAKYLVALNDKRQQAGRPEMTHSETAGRKLPEERRPTYDPCVRDANASSENTAEFTERVEGKKD